MPLAALSLIACSIPSACFAAEVPRIFQVADFGAVPDTPADSGDAIRAAIAAAMASGPGAEVTLDAGTYRVSPAPDQGFCFAVHGARGLTIRGAGEATRLINTNPASGVFHIAAGQNLVLRDLVMDYDPAPFTQGTVRAVDVEAGHFDLEIEPGYPTPDASNFVGAAEPYGKWGMIMDRTARRIKSGTPDHYMTPRWEHLQGRTFRFFTAAEHYRRGLAHMQVGDAYVHLARGYGGAVHADFCQGVRLEGLTVHSSPGLAVALVGNSVEAVVSGLRVAFPEGTDRLLTTNADGVHCQQNRVGPVIEGSTFQGMADDAVNIYAPPNILREVRSSTAWLVTGGCRVLPGDRLLVFAPHDGITRGVATVSAVTPEGPHLLLTLASPVEGAVAGEDHRAADTLYNLDACGAGFRITGNYMYGNRRYGCLLRAGEGLVEGNVFEDTTGGGVVLTNEPGWPEGPIPWGTTIRSNSFIRGGTCLGYADGAGGAAIAVRSLSLGFGLAPQSPARSITIEGNSFADVPGTAIYLGAAAEVAVRGNSISAAAGAPLLCRTSDIVIAGSSGVRLEGNAIEDLRPGLVGAVSVWPDTAPGEQGVTISGLSATLAPGKPPVDDQRK